MSPREFYDNIVKHNPNLEEDVVTLAEQWEQIGVDRGIQQGWQGGRQEGRQEGVFQEKKNTAQNLLKMGLPHQQIMQATGLSKVELARLAEKLESELEPVEP